MAAHHVVPFQFVPDFKSINDIFYALINSVKQLGWISKDCQYNI
jgi:hypothetical protein